MNRNKILPKTLLLFSSTMFFVIAVNFALEKHYGSMALFIVLGGFFTLLSAVRLSVQKTRNKWIDEFPNNVTSLNRSRNLFTYYTTSWYHICPLYAGAQLLLIGGLLLTVLFPYILTHTLGALPENGTAFRALLYVIGIGILWFWSLERKGLPKHTIQIPIVNFLDGYRMFAERDTFISFFKEYDESKAYKAYAFVVTQVPHHIPAEKVNYHLKQIEHQIQKKLKEEIPADISAYKNTRSIVRD